MPPRHRRSSGVDTINDIRRKISQQQAAITREFDSLQNCIVQKKLNQRKREEDEEAN
jgi:hypothetical protein